MSKNVITVFPFFKINFKKLAGLLCKFCFKLCISHAKAPNISPEDQTPRSVKVKAQISKNINWCYLLISLG